MKKAKQEIIFNRINTDVRRGLTSEQVAFRKEEGATNIVSASTGKTYLSIFLGNIFTFFNLLGLAIMLLMFILGSFKNLFFAVIILANSRDKSKKDDRKTFFGHSSRCRCNKKRQGRKNSY